MQTVLASLIGVPLRIHLVMFRRVICLSLVCETVFLFLQVTFPLWATFSFSSGTTVRTRDKTYVSSETWPRSGTKQPRHFTSLQPRSESSRRTTQATNQDASEKSSSSGSPMVACYPRLHDIPSTGEGFIICYLTLSRATWRLLLKVHYQLTEVTYVRHSSVRE